MDVRAGLGGGESLMASPLTNAQIQALWIANGGKPSAAPLMAAIAQAESGGNVSAHNTKAPDNSVGLWQINYYGGLNAPRTQSFGTPAALLSDANKQAKAAVSIYNSQGLSAWSTYTSGSYKQFLTGAAATTTTGSSTTTGTGGTPTPSSVTGGTVDTSALTGAASDLAAGVQSGAAGADQSAIYNVKCLISVPKVFGVGGACLLSKAEGRVLLGGLLLTAGGVISVVGVIILASYGLEASGAAGAAAKSVGAVAKVAAVVA